MGSACPNYPGEISSLKPMADAIFASDRDDNAKETIWFLYEKLKASAIGTHKRSLDFPFVFSEGKISKKHKGMVIAEKGFRSLYCARKKNTASSARQVEAALYRESVSGRIATV